MLKQPLSEQSQLNSYQKMAVSHKEGPALVLAGPGSGKTLVITHRIRMLIEEYGVAPEHILVITFTRAAATQMKTRFEELMEGQHLPVTFGTFHSVYFRVLKHAYHYDASQIIGEERRLRLLSEVSAQVEPAMAEEGIESLQELLSEISAVKSDMLDISHYYSRTCPEDTFREIYQVYEERLRKEQVIDFDDMLSLCFELFSARKDILSGWQRKYQYILCDEFQDINRLQYEILKLLALPENNLFIVGDDDQAIYRFRGARPELMLGFEKEYPGADRYLLAVNYRSSEKIIQAAENLISHNKVRFRKEISGTGKDGGPVILGSFPGTGEEYERILSHIRSYREAGRAYEEIAVLVRTNTGARKLLGKLMEYNIPFQTRDTVPCLYDHWTSGDIFAYIRAAMGDESRTVLLRIINKPCRYISRTVFSGSKVSLDEIEAMYEEKPWMAERIRSLREDLRAVGRLSPYQAVGYIRKTIGYDGYLKGYAKERHLEENGLLEILEELQSDAGEYKTFAAWFSHMSEYREEMRRQRENSAADRRGVVISTIHGAKGLEYPVVFLPDVNEQVIPHEKAGLSADVEEERRLFYVAMTRAKEKLHIYSVKERYGKSAVVSRFVDEIKSRKDTGGS
ncbi:ATP-dependent helicase [Qiania dongpingensis]|uniref:DNA 3'-5' helicase n=1 Tax=Qiania dongpingensis TaxID=2763669 RepID=A0A7G9G496_9FIRM|nr:ATP-dependent helicase [Qiania dongpingensis]QNM05628.1 ATP-dependent helicase [Qiania dongpingensis]